MYTASFMKYLTLLTSLILCSSCATYLAVETGKDNEDINPDIVEAVLADVEAVGNTLRYLGDVAQQYNKQGDDPAHTGSLDAECKRDSESKHCSAKNGCWCESTIN